MTNYWINWRKKVDWVSLSHCPIYGTVGQWDTLKARLSLTLSQSNTDPATVGLQGNSDVTPM